MSESSFEVHETFAEPFLEHRFYHYGHDVRNDYAGAQRLKQIHSPDCLVVDKPFETIQQGDALVTRQTGLAVFVETADCVPVLFYGRSADQGGAPVIAAAHAGWRGAKSGVLENTLKAMNATHVRACLGPCIRQENYEVSQEFKDEFLAEDGSNGMFFMDSVRDSHHMFDLPAYVVKRLKTAGVTKVDDVCLDTYALPNRFSSYRRATHGNTTYSGGQYSVIMIKS